MQRRYFAFVWNINRYVYHHWARLAIKQHGETHYRSQHQNYRAYQAKLGLLAHSSGHIHVDGGVTNPVPFDHVREGMDIVVAIDVTGKPKPSKRAHHSNMELALGSMLIMFDQLAELRRAANPPDIYIKPDVDQFGARDFFKTREIFETAAASKDKLKRALELRLNN